MAAESLFDSLWASYITHAPHALHIYKGLVALGEQPLNDHIALRTYGLEGMQIEDLARAFVDCGYERIEAYAFEEKKLDAWHYAHPEGGPKVFISALRVESLSDEAAACIRTLASQLQDGASRDPIFVNSGRHWRLDAATYERLREESEYAAWLAAFGFRANHFTILVNALKHFDSLAALNAHVEAEGLALSDAGGRIKGSPEVGLTQSSTRAQPVNVEFSDRTLRIPGSYYEFALRHEVDGQLFDGFIADNANRIFESTDRG